MSRTVYVKTCPLLEENGIMPRDTAPHDPARTVALLWGAGPTPGRTGLSVGALVAAGIEIADAGGLDAVSMRRVADHLGVAVMSLYTYVPARSDLVDLMVDAALAGLYEGVDALSGPWPEALRAMADARWRLFATHPWLLDHGSARPVLGPHTLVAYEAELRPLDGIGLTDVEMDAIVTLVLSHVAGAARARTDVLRAADVSGTTDAEWWGRVGPALAAHVDETRLPVSSRVGTATGAAWDAATSPQHALTFGLERIIDGVSALLAGRDGPTAR